MVKVLLQHSAAVFQSLPRNPKTPILKGRQLLAAEAREKFLAALPDTFDRPTYLKVADTLNIAVKTAERYLADLQIRPAVTSSQRPVPQDLIADMIRDLITNLKHLIK